MHLVGYIYIGIGSENIIWLLEPWLKFWTVSVVESCKKQNVSYDRSPSAVRRKWKSAEPTLFSLLLTTGANLQHGDREFETKIESLSKWPTRVVTPLSFSHLKTEADKKKNSLKAIIYVTRGNSVLFVAHQCAGHPCIMETIN